ncbi:MAG: hypothetical protein ACI85S_001555, partial [Pseudohongiellaceae bacterium]
NLLLDFDLGFVNMVIWLSTHLPTLRHLKYDWSLNDTQ